MLVITANWAIADGTIRGGPTQSVVQHFLQEVRRAAWRFGFRQSGHYKPIQSIKILLAGDTLDGLTTLAWGDRSRPWHNDNRTQVVAEKIFMRTMIHGSAFIKMLIRLSHQGITVPSADRRGRPIPGKSTKAPVSIICLAGDRDHILMGPWLTYISKRFRILFGNEWSSDTTVVRHGAEFDPLCGPLNVHTHDRAPTLCESLTIDLVLHFTKWLYDAMPFGDATKQMARILTTISPLDVPTQIAVWKRFGQENGMSSACSESIHEAWQKSVLNWYTHVFSSGLDTELDYDAADAIATWMSSTNNEARNDFLPTVPPCSSLPETTKDNTQPPNQRLLVLGHPPSTAIKDDAENIICLGQAQHTRHGRPHPNDFPGGIVAPSVRSIHRQQTMPLMDPTIPLSSRRGSVYVTPSREMTYGKGIIDAA